MNGKLVRMNIVENLSELPRRPFCRGMSGDITMQYLHINTTGHPTAEWVVQQLRETFPRRASIVM
jgi:hypothetical protein